MYKIRSKQIGFDDFEQPIGMNLNRDNRWVKKAESIPWDEIEMRYAGMFKNRKGNVAKPLRLALGACIIQAEYGYSDVETALQIQETAYLQFFCGYRKYDDEKMPFDPSLMVYFRKRLTAEVLGEINEMIIRAAHKPEEGDEDKEPLENKGTLIVDATCAPANIKYPQDTQLLNEARESAERLIDALHAPGDGKKPRTYRKAAKKAYRKTAKKRHLKAEEIRKTIKQQLQYLRRDLDILEMMLETGKALTPKQEERHAVLRRLYEQQKYMYDNRTHSVENRIVSISQPHIRPIVRGKARAKVEFGGKMDISVTDGWTRLEHLSFEAYNESTVLPSAIERFKERTGRYPKKILADKIYRNRENLAYCKERGIRLSGPALGRPKKNEVRDRYQDYRDECDRVEVERKISLAKRKCGIGLIMTKLPVTAGHSIALSVIVLNLRKVLLRLFDRRCFFTDFLRFLALVQKPVVVQ